MRHKGTIGRLGGSLSNPKRKVRVKVRLPKKVVRQLRRKAEELHRSANPRRTSLSEVVEYAIQKADLERLRLQDLVEWRKMKRES